MQYKCHFMGSHHMDVYTFKKYVICYMLYVICYMLYDTDVYINIL